MVYITFIDFISRSNSIYAKLDLDMIQINKKIKPWLIWASILLLFNSLAQHFPISVLQNLNEWDESMIFTIFSSDLLGYELGTQTFATYGPGLKYMGWPVGIDDPKIPLGIFIYIGFYLWCLFRFCQSPHISPLACLILVAALCLFNVPSIRYAPWVLFVWSLGKSSSKNYSNGLHEFFGILFVSFLFHYKASWGIIGILHLMFDAMLNKRQIYKWIILRSIALFLSLPTMYFLLTNQATWHSFFDYIWYSLEDSSAYAHNNNSPVELHFISSAWNGWQSSFHHWLGDEVAQKILKYLPLFFWMATIVAAFNPIKFKYYWLAFPVLLGEYKHSYVRADVTNLHGIFFILPLYLFILCLKSDFSHKKRKILIGSLVLWTCMEILGFFPYNIPRRHPRDFWLDNLWALNHQQELKKDIPSSTLNEKLSQFQWVKKHIKDETLLSIPARNELALLGNPLMLPSHQSYYTMEGQKRNLDDLKTLRETKPDYILFEDRTEYFRAGSMIQSPSFLNELLLNYQIVESHEDYSLFKKISKNKTLLQENLENLQLDHAKGSFEGKLVPGSVLYLKSTQGLGLKNKIWSILLKGARLHLSLEDTNGIREFDLSFDDLKRGVVLFNSLKLNMTSEKEQFFTLTFHGSGFSKYPHELTEEVLNDLQFHGILEQWTWVD